MIGCWVLGIGYLRPKTYDPTQYLRLNTQYPKSRLELVRRSFHSRPTRGLGALFDVDYERHEPVALQRKGEVGEDIAL